MAAVRRTSDNAKELATEDFGLLRRYNSILLVEA